MTEIVGVLLCAGSAERMGFDKLTTPLGGKTAICRSAEALLSGGVTRLLLVVNPVTAQYAKTLAFAVPCDTVAGGATRRESVKNALLHWETRASEGDIAVIHDAARCMVTPAMVKDCIASALKYGSGIASHKATDTVLQDTDGAVTVIPRETVRLMQTPQVFSYREILSAYRTDADATDDCTLYAMAGYTPRFVECGSGNYKLTAPEDWARALSATTAYGTGFDTHRLVENRRLILGGVEIPFEKGLLGHSDADVLLHAVMDALLGAASLGDIGKLFPDNDPAYCGADSMVLLGEVIRRLSSLRLSVGHIDATVIAQRPKLAPYIDRMRENIATVCGISKADVSVKATTTEGMNDEGQGKCISACAIASLR